MSKPNAIACPGCGAAIPKPTIYDEEGGWLAPPAWCDGCGGTARRLETPLTYGPRWYAMVAAAFDKVSPMMGLVLDPDSVEPLWDQAYSGAEASVMEPMSDSEEAIEIDAAERTALAIGVLAYGVEFARPSNTTSSSPAQTPQGNPGITLDNIRVAEEIARDTIDDYTEDDVMRIARQNFQDEERKRRMTTEFFDRIRAGDESAIDEAIYLIQVHALPDDHPMWIDG
jgi:hypothetical protein